MCVVFRVIRCERYLRSGFVSFGGYPSFISLTLSKRFVDAMRELDYPSVVYIINDGAMRISRVHRGCTLELFIKQYPIDLVPIPLYQSKVIVGIDWLSTNGAIIECDHQLVRIPTQSGGSC